MEQSKKEGKILDWKLVEHREEMLEVLNYVHTISLYPDGKEPVDLLTAIHMKTGLLLRKLHKVSED